jgi:toluene monooxygenase electron transfer component
MKILVNARNCAHHFKAAGGEKILFAGLQQAIGLPYECASGTCGTCKARLTSGEVTDLWPDAPGRKYLKQPGEFLMCQAGVCGDVSVEVSNFVYAIDPGACLPAAFAGMMGNLRLLAQDIAAFSIELDRPCDYDAGQFMLMQIPGVPGYRGYSMVNFERNARRLDFVVKRKAGGGASEWLFNSSVDAKPVELFGPLGAATFFPALGRNLLLIAGGSGIAGMMAILSRAVQERYFDEYTCNVFFGVRTMSDTFFLDELTRFHSEYPQKVSVTVALSEEDVPVEASSRYPDLTFDRGLVHEVAARHMKGRYQNMRAYLAGPPPAVDAAIRVLLLQAKLTADNIRYDKFS